MVFSENVLRGILGLKLIASAYRVDVQRNGQMGLLKRISLRPVPSGTIRSISKSSDLSWSSSLPAEVHVCLYNRTLQAKIASAFATVKFVMRALLKPLVARDR